MTREASAGAGGGASPPLEWFAGLAAASLGLAAAVTLGYPPEVWPASGVAVGLLLAIGLVAAGRRLPLPAVLVAAGFLLVNLAVSLSPGRTIDAVARLVLPTVAFLVASSVARRSRPPVLFGIAAVGASLGFVAVLQKGGLLAREAVLARELGLAAEVIYRLEQERAFAT
ncbi:MAG: hypothetical protein OEQ13_04635, partial [Acidobacteriota bacterium]|nr:hypothetical protein [Acidobacteriota bacterium]